MPHDISNPGQAAEYGTLVHGTGRTSLVEVKIAWNGSTYIDETERLKNVNFNKNLAIGGSNLTEVGTVDVGSLTLDNSDRYLSPFSGSASAAITRMASDIGIYGVPITIRSGFYLPGAQADLWFPSFTGFLYGYTPDPRNGTVRFSLRDNGFLEVQKRKASALYFDYTFDELFREYYGNILGTNLTNADIDETPFFVPHAWLDYDPMREEGMQLAESIAGNYFYSDEGYVCFWDSAHFLDVVVAENFTADDIISSVPEQPETRDLASRVSVEHSPRYTGPIQPVYVLPDEKIIPPNDSISFDVAFSLPIEKYIDPEEGRDFWFTRPGGVIMNDFCSLTLSNVQAQRATITLTNTNTVLSATLDNFILQGVPIIGWPSSEETEDANQSIDRDRATRNSFYIQTKRLSDMLLSFYKVRYSIINRTFSFETWGFPHLVIGDKVTFTDGDHVSTPMNGIITNINTDIKVAARSQSPHFSQRFTVIASDHIYPNENFFRIGDRLDDAKAWH